MHELPPRGTTVQVAETGAATQQALKWLRTGGRDAEAVACEHGPAEPGRLWRPNAWLEEVLPSIPPGRAIDFGCGSGREAVALAAYGWEVTALDRLEDALEKARELEIRTLGDPTIAWTCADIEAPGYEPPGVADLICSFAYLHRPLLQAAPQRLAPGGHLVVETFTTIHRERFGKPRTARFVLEPGELLLLCADLELVHHSEAWREDGRHTARLSARKSV